MSDICEQLRKARTHALMSASRQTVLDAAAEIERLRLTARDQFAAAALTGLTSRPQWAPDECVPEAYRLADSMLAERFRISRIAKTTDHDAAPAAKASEATASPERVRVRGNAGTGDTFVPDAYRRFVGEVMEWISEATSIYEPRSDGGRRIMADACMKCWDAFNRIAYPTKNHDAVPEATAESGRPLVYEDLPHASGTGKQTAPPCVETDGFSSDSRTGPINRTPECESPRRECGESSRRDVPQDDNSRATGGPAHLISEAEIDALECVVEDGRMVTMSVYGHLRSLLVRLRPEWEDESDRPQPVKDGDSDRSKPINDGRLAALEQLSALDQELELEHGVSGNPMIKAQPCKAAKTDTTQPRNGALSDGPDPDSRVWETPCTPQPHATPTQGSEQGEGTNPVAWAIERADGGSLMGFCHTKRDATRFAHAIIECTKSEHFTLRHVPLYRQPQPTLTDEEREAVQVARDAYADDDGNAECEQIAAVLSRLLERTK